MDKKSSKQKPGLNPLLLRKSGGNYTKPEEPFAEIDKRKMSLEQIRSSRGSRSKAITKVIPNYSSLRYSSANNSPSYHLIERASSTYSSSRHSYRDEQKVHSLDSAVFSRNPFHAKVEAKPSDLIFDMSEFSIGPKLNSVEEYRSTRSTEVKEQPDAVDVDASINHKQRFIINHCQLRSSEPLNVYIPVMNATYEDHRNFIRKFDIGDSNRCASEKVIMLVGATGSGKSTLVNGLFNYIFDVKWGDTFRLKLIEENVSNQAHSITKYITAYTIHHQEGLNVPYTITVIDTPGFGDTKGITRDQEITRQIKTFFTTAGPNGIDRLDAVAFVAQSSLARLTPSQKYIFESILVIFGKDIAHCIVLLLTFADGQKPQIIDSIKEANFPYVKHFKFNSSALYISNKDKSSEDSDDEEGDDTTMGEMFWEIGEKSFRSFITELSKIKPTSLVQTKEVLDERMKLEISIEGIQKEIKLSLGKLEKLAKEVKVLNSHEEDIDKNKDIEYEVNDVKYFKRDTAHGQNTTNCLKCSVTCHERCIYKNDSDKIKCDAMTKEYCRICPEKCFWNMHRNQPYVFVYTHETKVNTLQGLKVRYEEAKGKKLLAEQVVKECASEFEAAQVELLSLAEAARKSIQRLEEIALRPNPLSVVEYIDVLINGEKLEGKPFWKERVNQLEEVRKKAVYVQQIIEWKLDPFEEYRERVIEERKEKRRGVWTRAAEYLERGFGVKF